MTIRRRITNPHEFNLFALEDKDNEGWYKYVLTSERDSSLNETSTVLYPSKREALQAGVALAKSLK